MLTSMRPTATGWPPDSREQRGEAVGEMNAAALHADDDHGGTGFIALDNFVGDAGEDAMNGLSVEDDGGFRHESGETSKSNALGQERRRISGRKGVAVGDMP
jgi:hypothetical protein